MTTPISIDPETPVMKVVADLFREEVGTVYQRTVIVDGIDEHQTMTLKEDAIGVHYTVGEKAEAWDWTMEDFLDRMDQARIYSALVGEDFGALLDETGFNEADKEWIAAEIHKLDEADGE